MCYIVYIRTQLPRTTMPQSSTMTIRVDSELKSRLEQLAETTHRSKSFLAAEAIREFVEQNEWQLKEIEQALAEAEAGDFASVDEVNDLFRRWDADGD